MLNSNLKKYIINNSKEYTLVGLIFVIGIFCGVMIINNCKESQIKETKEYIETFITSFKQTDEINNVELIFESIKNNIFLAIILWFAGTTIIGLPVVLMVVFFRGIVLGVTISAITFALDIAKGIIFCIIAILGQNLLFIPAILTLGVSSIKLYKSIIKDKRRENVKFEIFRHTIISILMIIVLIASSVVENVISINCLKNFIKFF